MTESKIITIGSDKDALDFIGEYLEHEFFYENLRIIFEDWPALNIRITGQDFDASLKTTQMRALIKLQETIYYQYSVLAGQDKDNLSGIEKNALELRISINKGSTELITGLAKILEFISNANTSNAAIAGVVAIAAIYGAKAVSEKYFDYKNRELDIEDKKITIIGDLSRRNKELESLINSALNAMNAIARSVGKDDSIFINNVEASRLPKTRISANIDKQKSSILSIGKFYDGKFIVTGLHRYTSNYFEFEFEDSDGLKLCWRVSANDISKKLHHKISTMYNSKGQIYIGYEPTKKTGEYSYGVVVRRIFDHNTKPSSIQ